MTLSKDKILQALPTFSKSELNEILQLCTSLLNEGDEETDGKAELWFNAFVATLGSKQRFGHVKKTAVGAALRRNAADAEAFLNSVLPEQIKRKLGRAAVRRFLAELLIADLKRIKLTPTPRILANNLPRLAEVVDDAFPHYRASGLTHLIFDRFAGGSK